MKRNVDQCSMGTNQTVKVANCHDSQKQFEKQLIILLRQFCYAGV